MCLRWHTWVTLAAKPRPTQGKGLQKNQCYGHPWTLVLLAEVCGMCSLAFSYAWDWYVVYRLPWRLGSLELLSHYMPSLLSIFPLEQARFITPCFPSSVLYVTNSKYNKSEHWQRGWGCAAAWCWSPSRMALSVQMTLSLAATLLKAVSSRSICFGWTSSESFHSCQTGLHLLWFCMLFRSWPTLQQHITLTLDL